MKIKNVIERKKQTFHKFPIVIFARSPYFLFLISFLISLLILINKYVLQKFHYANAKIPVWSAKIPL